MTRGCQGGYLCHVRGYREWYSEAACRQNIESIKTFDTNPRKARKTCRSCPVAGDCLAYAIIYDEHGVWGGMTEDERHNMLKRNPLMQLSLQREARALGIFENRFSAADQLQSLRGRPELEAG